MNVKNRKCIRKLSLKSLYANRRRNLIAIFAIALTTLLFTSMFTIVLSLNASYETYQFRQVGGYAHGTFKDVSPEQAERIVDCQHFFRQIFLGYFSDIVQAFDTLRKNVCGDDYTSLHNPIVLSSVLPAYGMFHSIQILFL